MNTATKVLEWGDDQFGYAQQYGSRDTSTTHNILRFHPLPNGGVEVHFGTTAYFCGGTVVHRADGSLVLSPEQRQELGAALNPCEAIPDPSQAPEAIERDWCAHCNGSGVEPAGIIEKCGVCGGSGSVGATLPLDNFTATRNGVPVSVDAKMTSPTTLSLTVGTDPTLDLYRTHSIMRVMTTEPGEYEISITPDKCVRFGRVDGAAGAYRADTLDRIRKLVADVDPDATHVHELRAVMRVIARELGETAS